MGACTRSCCSRRTWRVSRPGPPRQAVHERRRVGRSARVADSDQGHADDGRHPHDQRLGLVRGPRSGTRRRGRGARTRGRRRHPGQDQCLRAGLRGDVPEPARPRRRQSLEPRSHARRVQRRGGGGACRVSVPAGDRQRRWRLDPHSVPLLRDIRDQAHAGAGVVLQRRPIRAGAEHLLPERTPGPHGAGRRAAAAGPGRARPARPALDPRRAGRLRRRGGPGDHRPARRVDS